jgi:hypothetical protein
VPSRYRGPLGDVSVAHSLASPGMDTIIVVLAVETRWRSRTFHIGLFRHIFRTSCGYHQDTTESRNCFAQYCFHHTDFYSALTQILLSTQNIHSNPLGTPNATPIYWPLPLPFFLLRGSVLRHEYGPAFGFMGAGGCWMPVAGSTRPVFGQSRLSRSLLGAKCQSCVSTLQLVRVLVPNMPVVFCISR